MTEQHPLTDETCNELSIFPLKALDDKYAGVMMTDMRAAADWQLEQVIEWIKECPSYDLETCFGLDRMITDLKKAMRPHEGVPSQ